MPFADEVFRYAPALKGRITPPEQSELRLSYQRFEELDAQARTENWPDGWRMSHADREANRRAVLDGRLDRDLWVFAYGSLIWDPALHLSEIRMASLTGWSRRFCMQISGGRGTHDHPGLMAALDHGGICNAVAFRLRAELVAQETEILWMREMFSGSYSPVFLPAKTPQGEIEVLTFVMDRENERYVPDLSEDQAAYMIATAKGNLGENFSYLESLISHLAELGIPDADMTALYQRACTYRTVDG